MLLEVAFTYIILDMFPECDLIYKNNKNSNAIKIIIKGIDFYINIIFIPLRIIYIQT